MSLGLGRWLARGPGEAAVEILARLRAAGVRTLLDIPAGVAPVRARARELGFDVFEADLIPRRGMRGAVADCCAALPFRDGSFECVLCMEGLEHFENQTGFLRECARILAPGGRLVVTTPSVHHLDARLAMLLTGQRTLQQGLLNEVSGLRERRGERLYHGHAYFIDPFRLRYILRVLGFELEQVTAAELSLGSVALFLLVPFIWLATGHALRRGRLRQRRHGRPVPSPAVERELRRIALSPTLLFGKRLVLVARKPPATRK